MFKIIYYNLILEWDGLLRILHCREDKIHSLDIKLFLGNYPKRRYILNWIVFSLGKCI